MKVTINLNETELRRRLERAEMNGEDTFVFYEAPPYEPELVALDCCRRAPVRPTQGATRRTVTRDTRGYTVSVRLATLKKHGSQKVLAVLEKRGLRVAARQFAAEGLQVHAMFPRTLEVAFWHEEMRSPTYRWATKPDPNRKYTARVWFSFWVEKGEETNAEN